MKGWSLNAKFIAILGIFVASAMSISAVSLWRIEQISESVTTLVTVYAKRVSYGQDLQTKINEIRNMEKVFILEDSPEGMTKVGAQLDNAEKVIRENVKAFESVSTEQGKKEAKELVEVIDEWKPVSMQIRQFSMAGKNAEAISLARGKSKALLEKFATVLDATVSRNSENMVVAEKNANDLVRNTTITVLALALSSALVGLGLAKVVLSSVNRAIDRVIANLSENADQVASAATQIASTSEELSQSTTEQAASLQQTASSVEELSSMVQKNSENSRRAQSLSGQSQSAANEGNRVVGELLQAMNEIDRSNEDILTQITRSNQQITDIVKVIAEIGSKTRVINDIVFQTKLLSFNASVEAARAGEHGKGFAVVAEEVGNLAQMSGNAAKEISAMLESSIQKVEGIVQETKSRVEGLVTTGKSKVTLGLNVAQQCERVLREIAQGVTDTASMSQSIAAASDEQAKGIQEINKAMTQLDGVTQLNASASEETSSAAEQLAEQASTLQTVVNTLVQNIWGHARAAEHAATGQSTRSRKSTSSRSMPKAGNARFKASRLEPKSTVDFSPGSKELPYGVPTADDTRFDSTAA